MNSKMHDNESMTFFQCKIDILSFILTKYWLKENYWSCDAHVTLEFYILR